MLVTRSSLRRLIIEALLIERIYKAGLIKKYRYLDAYSIYLDKLNPKYYDSLGRIIEELRDQNLPEIDHGVIIFMFLMHQKYASTDLLANEYKDFSRLKLDDLKKAIEGLGAQYTDGALYGELVELDKKQTQKMLDDDKEEVAQSGSEEKYTAAVKEVRPGLFHIKTEEGWQILRPETVAGSQAIGVKSWCTVYSDAFSNYKSNGITLYYCVKDGKNYDEKGYGFDYVANPYDYFCIGFHDNEIYIPSGKYESSVWGNQEGVTYQNLSSHLGLDISKKIINVIKYHFKKVAGISPKGGQKEYLERKYRQALATNPRVLKKVARSMGPDQTLEMIFEVIDNPKLNDQTLDFIFNKYFKKIDSKMRKTSIFSNKGEAGYLFELSNKILNVHKQFSEDQASALANCLLDNFKAYNSESAFQRVFSSSLWSANLGHVAFERMLSMINVSEFENYDSPKTRAKLTDFDEKFPFKAFESCLDKKNQHAANAFFEKYNLGIYDTFLFNFTNRAKSQMSGADNVMDSYSDSYTGALWSIFAQAQRSNLTPQNVKDDLVKLKISNSETMPHKDLHYSTCPYKDFYSSDMSQEDKEKIGIQDISEELKAAAEVCDRYISFTADGYFYRELFDNITSNDASEIRNIVVAKMKEYLDNHNKLFDAFPNSKSMNSTMYKEIIQVVAAFPPEDSITMLDSIKGLNRNNDYYFVHNFISSVKSLERGDEYFVEIFDWANIRANEKAARGEDTQTFLNRLSRMVYGGYDGMKNRGQAQASYNLYKKNPQVFLKCLEYALLYLDYNDSRYPQTELSKMLPKLVNLGIMTYEQALIAHNEINKKIEELGMKLLADGKLTEYKVKSMMTSHSSGGYISIRMLESLNPDNILDDDVMEAVDAFE